MEVLQNLKCEGGYLLFKQHNQEIMVELQHHHCWLYDTVNNSSHPAYLEPRFRFSGTVGDWEVECMDGRLHLEIKRRDSDRIIFVMSSNLEGDVPTVGT